MKRNLFVGGAIIALLIIAVVAYVLRPSEEASAPIEAVPIEATVDSSEVDEARSDQADTQEEDEMSETTVDDVSETAAAGSGTVIYTISQADSGVRFNIDELLRNQPVTAVGITDQIAGEISINFDNPAESQVGQITVNARTLATDNGNRNRMIQNEILDTADYEFITFTPTAVTGLPESVPTGEIISFQITGDLTIRAITAPLTFEVTATVNEDGTLMGYAISTVLRSDYDLTIPSVPSVAEVSDEVIVEFDFVANPK